MLHAHTMEKEEMASRADNQIEELQEELAKVQRDRDEALLLAENDRQQVWQLSLDSQNGRIVTRRCFWLRMIVIRCGNLFSSLTKW